MAFSRASESTGARSSVSATTSSGCTIPPRPSGSPFPSRSTRWRRSPRKRSGARASRKAISAPSSPAASAILASIRASARGRRSSSSWTPSSCGPRKCTKRGSRWSRRERPFPSASPSRRGSSRSTTWRISWLRSKGSRPAPTKCSCSTAAAAWRRAPARTSSWSSTDASARRRPSREFSRVSPAT